VQVSTDDGSAGHKGYVHHLVEKALAEDPVENPLFLNCGPEVAMKALDAVERKHAPPGDIFHIIERYTSCGVGICGKCATPSGLRSCIDGPAFSSAGFTPGVYERDKTGKKVYFDRH